MKPYQIVAVSLGGLILSNCASSLTGGRPDAWTKALIGAGAGAVLGDQNNRGAAALNGAETALSQGQPRQQAQTRPYAGPTTTGAPNTTVGQAVHLVDELMPH